jgi:hypothetical protein
MNEAIYTTTLHTVLNFGMMCKMYNIQLEVNIVPDRTCIQKYLKTCDRLVWIDYGVSIDSQAVAKFSIPFPEGVHVMMIPTVLPNINWDRFKMKTKMGTPEPVNQRGLDFDTAVIESKDMFKGVSEFVKCSNDGRIVAFDSKPVLKKMTSSVSVNKMKEDGIKIGVLNGDSALCHYTYECIGNILETSGITLSNE